MGKNRRRFIQYFCDEACATWAAHCKYAGGDLAFLEPQMPSSGVKVAWDSISVAVDIPLCLHTCAVGVFSFFEMTREDSILLNFHRLPVSPTRNSMSGMLRPRHICGVLR